MDKKSTEKNVPKRRRAAAKKGDKKVMIATVSVIAVVCILILGCVGYVFFKGDSGSNVASGICVGDIELEGKTRQQVEESLAALNGAFDDSEIVLSVEGKSGIKNIKASDIALEFDLEKTVERVFSEENTGGFFKKNSKKDVGYAFKYDAVALTGIVDEFTSDVGGDLREHEVVIGEDSVTVKAGKPGKGISVKDAEEIILNSFKPYAKTEAKVAMSEAEPKEMTVDYLYDITKAEVKNAEYVYEGGSITVSEEVDGREIDREDAKKKLEGFGVGSDDVKIKLIVTPAEKTKQQLESRLFSDVIGQYSSKYNAALVNRSANVELAARNINGKVLMPGEVFSYNETVGPRTAERGFKVASVYEANRVADGLGGGICQTCSTLYPAVLYADLEVVERRNHSLEVSYVPLGMDATVAWNSLDFKFKNSTSYPIKIQCSYGGGNVSVSLLGTKENKSKSVKVITERVSYTPFTTGEVPDDTLKPGERVSESNGFNGSTVNTYKVYYENGVEVKREYIGKSVYRMAEKVWRVGPAVETPPPEVTGDPALNGGGEPLPEATENPMPEASAQPDVPVASSEPITSDEIQEQYPEGI